jgi:hypothetical protein
MTKSKQFDVSNRNRARMGSAQRHAIVTGSLLLVLSGVAAVLTPGVAASQPAAALTSAVRTASPNTDQQMTPYVISQTGSNDSGILNGVSCPTTTYCVAVGSSEGLPLIESTTSGPQGTWSITSNPPHVPSGSELSAVSCISESWCVAVGSSLNDNIFHTLILTMTSTGWTITNDAAIRKPKDPGPKSNIFYGVSCASTKICVAVGQYIPSGSSSYSTLVEYSIDGQWKIITSPNGHLVNNTLGAVSCVKNTLFCIAVGYGYSGSTYETLAEEITGSPWTASLVSSPNTSPNFFYGVSCASSSVCVAVGQTGNSPIQTLEERFSHGAFGAQLSNLDHLNASNDPTTNILYGVSCLGTYCQTAGDYTAKDPLLTQTLAGVLPSTSVQTPNKKISGDAVPNLLDAISCPSRSLCAVAGQFGLPGSFRTLIEWGP